MYLKTFLLIFIQFLSNKINRFFVININSSLLKILNLFSKPANSNKRSKSFLLIKTSSYLQHYLIALINYFLFGIKANISFYLIFLSQFS